MTNTPALSNQTKTINIAIKYEIGFSIVFFALSRADSIIFCGVKCNTNAKPKGIIIRSSK